MEWGSRGGGGGVGLRYGRVDEKRRGWDGAEGEQWKHYYRIASDSIELWLLVVKI